MVMVHARAGMHTASLLRILFNVHPSLQGLAMADEREHPATHNNTLSPAEFWAGAGVLVCTHAIGLPASMRENPHAKTLVAIRPSIT